MINSNVDNGLLAGRRFIDLFAGIGAFRYALESFGAKCVFSSEWDKSCQDTYERNHGDRPVGDITKIASDDIPPHDIICAGFPCQPFSINGKQKGFSDEMRGTLFFDICRIAAHHRPWMLLLENVGNLATHDSGRTLHVIIDALEGMGYDVNHGVLDASLFGVPQHRERVFFVCTLESKAPDLPQPLSIPVVLQDVLLPPDEVVKYVIDAQSFEGFELDEGPKRPRLSPIRVGKIQGGRQGERIYHSNGHSITLSSNGGGIGAKTGMYLVGDVVRRLAPRECARLTGLPDTFVLNGSDSQCYRQFGNSLVVDVVQQIVKQLKYQF